MVIQSVNKGVELVNRHDGNSFKNTYFLFYEGDDKGDRILVRDGFIKRGPFFMLYNSAF